jgi:DNA gyrase subunit A
MGRASRGVRAIRLGEDDSVVGVSILRQGATLVTVSESGKGRRTSPDDYRIQRRGGRGILNYRGGGVAALKSVDAEDDIILISAEGIIIRMHISDIRVQSRYGQGVRVMRLGEGDRVVTMARTERDEGEEVNLSGSGDEEATGPTETADV